MNRRPILMTLCALAVAGCSLLAPQVEQAADRTADGINRYCSEVPQSERVKFRTLVNSKTPHHIQVECAGDSESSAVDFLPSIRIRSVAMSETEQTVDSPAAAPGAPAAPAAADAGAPAKPESTAKGPARSPAESALQRAKERFASQNSPAKGAADAAAAAEPAAGASAEATAQGDSTDDQAQATGAQSGEERPAAGSIAAPEDWPADQVAAFKGLPNDEARQLVLDQYKAMQAGFTVKLQDIATIKQQHGALVDAMQQHGQDADSLIDLMGTAKAFDADPRGTLAQLAEKAGVEVFFERPLPAGEVPEFETQAEMLAWLQKQSQDTVNRALAEERSKAQAEQRRTQAREAIQRQFADAQSQHKDFETHRSAVVENLAAIAENGPTVDQAYRLATYDGLRKLALDGQKAIAELAQLKQQQERAAKQATTVPAAKSRSGKDANGADQHLSPAERAMKRAQQRMSAAGNGSRAA